MKLPQAGLGKQLEFQAVFAEQPHKCLQCKKQPPYETNLLKNFKILD